MAQLAQIWRHPIKGVGAENLARTVLETGCPLPMDRAWALLTGDSEDTGAWQPCRNFARGCYGPELMAVTASTLADGQIALQHPRAGEITVNPDTDTAALVHWVQQIYPSERPAPKALIKSPTEGMADADYASISILSLASLSSLSQRLQTTLDPRRFRGNLWVSGTDAFQEFDWVGKTLRIGDTEVHVKERIGRCRATEANPDTGQRDADTLRALREGWGHTQFGVMATVITAGAISVGDTVEVLE